MKPTQGSWYTVVYGDTIRKISRLAYGRDLSSFIVNANYDTLKDRELSLEGIPLIFSGDKLFLPVYKNRYNNETITADFDTQIEVRLNGVRLPGVKTGRIGRQMNQIASGFIFEVPFDPYNRDQVDLLRPLTWHPAQLYIGGELYITALAAKWDYSESDAGTVAKIECRTMPGEMLECMGMRKSLVFKKGMTLLDICREVAAPYGITCYSSSGSGGVAGWQKGGYVGGKYEAIERTGYDDNGGSAARFFYCAKASKEDRDEGLEEFEVQSVAVMRAMGNNPAGKIDPVSERFTTIKRNTHPTVKPTDLMRYLVRLVTPPGGTCLDMFMGSGSTGKACKYEGFGFIGIDLEDDHIDIAKARIQYADKKSREQPDLFKAKQEPEREEPTLF